MGTQLTHKDIRSLGFTGTWNLYKKGNVTLRVYDDDDRMDIFYASTEGKDGEERVRTYGDLEEYLENELIELQ